MTSYYTISDFTNKVYGGFKYELPDAIAKILKNLSNSVSPTDESSSSSSNSTSNAYVKKTVVKNHKPFQEDWSAVRSYKTTKLPEVKEGTEKSIKDIRVALNKFSNKNADTQHDVIVNLINQVISESKEVEEDTKKVINLIFDIVSSNEFYSALYAKLYKDLIGLFPAFSEKMVDIVDRYKESFNNIKLIDPNVDYDGYCAYVKSNDLRRAMTSFIVNLMKNQAMKESDVIDIIIYLENLVFKFAEEAEKSVTIEEITENIFILITENKNKLNTNALWKDTIIPNIHAISKLRKTDAVKYQSMTSRSTFKFMDIIDAIKN
jgi:hypothetical protein